MILGRGTAQTDEDIITDYLRCLEESGHITGLAILKRVREAGQNMSRRIGKAILSWSDEDILALYEHRSHSTWVSYNVFVSFLLFRGYRRASMHLLTNLSINLSTQWQTRLVPYQERLTRTGRELGYAETTRKGLLNILLWLLVFTQKPLEEMTRPDFEAFRTAHEHWYRQAGKRPSNKGHDPLPDPRLFRLEGYLMHWKILRPVNKPLRYELQVAQIRHAVFQRAFVDYCKWREVKYRPTTAKCSRGELLIFFLWLQEHSPDVSCLSELTRPVALAFALYLKQQGEEGRSGPLYRHSVYSRARHFVDFAMKEWPDIAPLRNPFAADDLPPKPEMVPRYLDDRDIRAVLQYCEQEASLLERTMVITLLHTGIRACELAALKASDMVQVGGAWKLHIHEGKGLKDRLIPLTARCVEVRQAWQAQGWERVNDFLFTRFGRPWKNSNPVCERIAKLGSKLGIVELSPHRFRHTFAVALLNYGIRESALQKLMGHAEVGMTLEYARILDQTVERGFTEAVTHMQEGARSWIPNFFVQEECTLFAEGDAVSWIRLPMGYCRRNPKLHCESDVKCLLCDRFAIGGEDLPRLQQMYERFMKLGLKLKADVVAAQIRRLEAPSEERNGSQGFVPMHAISVSGKRR